MNSRAIQYKTGRGGNSVPTSDLIISAFRALLLRRQHNFTVDDVAKEANVVRQTIYNLFGNREGLLKAVVETVVRDYKWPELLPERDDDMPATLRKWALDYLKMMLSPESVALLRLLVAEAVELRRLTRFAHDSGQGKLITMLGNYLGAQMRAGRLMEADASTAAAQLQGMLVGQARQRALFALPPMSRSEQAAYVISAIELFLRGLQPVR